MPYSEKQCLHCGQLFVGDARTVFCSNQCRWRRHSAENYARKKGADVPKREKKQKDPAAQARGRANRAKGARVEREVCHVIHDITGDEVRRNLSQTRDAGGDVKWGPFYFEVKYQQTLALPAWQRQAVQSAAEDPDQPVPAVVYRRANEDFWVSLPFRVFIAMFNQLKNAAQAAQDHACEEKP